MGFKLKSSMEKEMAAHSNILAWKIPWTGEAGGLQSMWSQRVGHNFYLGAISHLYKGQENQGKFYKILALIIIPRKYFRHFN